MDGGCAGRDGGRLINVPPIFKNFLMIRFDEIRNTHRFADFFFFLPPPVLCILSRCGKFKTKTKNQSSLPSLIEISLSISLV